MTVLALPESLYHNSSAVRGDIYLYSYNVNILFYSYNVLGLGLYKSDLLMVLF